MEFLGGKKKKKKIKEMKREEAKCKETEEKNH